MNCICEFEGSTVGDGYWKTKCALHGYHFGKAQAELAQLRGENERLKGQKDKLSTCLHLTTQDRDRLQAQLDGAQAERKTLLWAAEALKAERDQARTELGEAINRHNALADSLAEARAEIADADSATVGACVTGTENAAETIEFLATKLYEARGEVAAAKVERDQALGVSAYARQLADQSEKAREELESLLRSAKPHIQGNKNRAIQLGEDVDDWTGDELTEAIDTLLARIEGK